MDELEAIIQRATDQIEGGFSPESDAMTALHLAIDLAKAVMQLRDEAGL